MTSVAVVFPYRAGCPHRDMAFRWVKAWWGDMFPDWRVVVGESPDGPFSRTAAILDGASKVSADVLVVADADVIVGVPHVLAAVHGAMRDGWAKPHRLIHRLSGESTDRFMAGSDWRGLPLSTDNRQDSKPYEGNATGTMALFRRDVFDTVPPDPRFRGWGQEDLAWCAALTGLCGPHWQGEGDLVHLWHPPQERKSRAIGNEHNVALWQRYATAKPARLRELVEEARQAWTSHTSGQPVSVP